MLLQSSEPDDVLIKRAQADATAFEPLYERYVAQVYAYAYYRLGNTQDAEDVTARTFYQALTHLVRYANRGVPFSAWLFRIAHNLIANWHRDHSRRRTLPLDLAIDVPTPTASLMEHAENREELHTLWEAVRFLPPERQQLLVLKFVEDLPNAEIAMIMGRSEGAVKALLHRTLVTLRHELNHIHQIEQPTEQMSQ